VLPGNRLRELLDFAEFLKWLEARQQSANQDEDAAAAAWATGVANECSAELSEAREDIYTLNDGEPVRGKL
jgi:hypothetical protein